MANNRQAIKRIKIGNKKALINKVRKSALRTMLKKSKAAISNKETNATDILKEATRSLDKAVAKNIIHKNNAARHKSSLTKAYNASISK